MSKESRENFVNERLNKERIVLTTTDAKKMSLILNHSLIQEDLIVINFLKKRNYLDGYLSPQTIANFSKILSNELQLTIDDYRLLAHDNGLTNLYPL